MKVNSLFFRDGVGHSIRTREEWLLRLANAMRPSFELIGHPVPDQLRVTCGWPSKGGRAPRHQRMGECWSPEASADQTVEIFISPCLGDKLQVAEVLVHEMIHAAGAPGHRGKFPKIAKALGLRKPWRATRATEELKARLNALITKIGPYPHATLDASMTPRKKDGTRLLKLICPNDGYTIRTTEKWVRIGLPACPCGSRLELAALQAELKVIV
jgi:hypothetical protein